jgi:hypothetical protein
MTTERLFSTNLIARRFDIYDLPASLSRCLLATMWLSIKYPPVLHSFPMPEPELTNHCGYDRDLTSFLLTNLIARIFDIYDPPVSLSRCLLATMWLSIKHPPVLQSFPMPEPELTNHCGHDQNLTSFLTNLIARRFDIYDPPASLSRCLFATMWRSVEDLLPVLQSFPMMEPDLANHCGHDGRHPSMVRTVAATDFYII